MAATKATKVTSRKRVKQPAKRAPSKEKKLLEAYGKLGVDPVKVHTTPQITHILKRLPPKGIHTALEYLRGADDDEARKWLSLYDDMPVSLRDILPFEAYCVATGISTRRMLEIITGACFEQTDVAAKLIAAAAHPDIVTSTAKSAMYLGREGVNDRKMMHLHKGFLPVPKNQTTIISGHGQQNNLQLNQSNQVTFAVGEIQGIEKVQARIADRFNERLGLGASRSLPLAPAPDNPVIIETEVEPEPEFEPTGWDI